MNNSQIFILAIVHIMEVNCFEMLIVILYCYPGGYEAFSALYPFHRTQQILYMPQVGHL